MRKFRFVLKPRHKRLLKLIERQKVRLILAMILTVVFGLTSGAIGFLVKPILDDIFLSKDRVMLTLIFSAVIGVYILRGLSNFGNAYLMNYVGQDIIRRIRIELFDSVIEQSLSFFHRERTGSMMSIITNDVRVLRVMVTSAVTSFFKDLFSVVCLVVVIFYRDWLMAIIVIGIFSCAVYPIQTIGRKVRKARKECQQCIADFNCYLHETFQGNKIVKAFGMETSKNEAFFESTDRLFNFEMKVVKAKAIASPIMEVLGGIGIGLVIFYGGYRVVNGDSTPGNFFSFMTSAMLLYDPVKRLSNLNADVQTGLAAADRIYDIAERKPDIEDPEKPVQLSAGPRSVVFEDVSFSYGEETILRNIDISVEPGEIVALVGTSGAGKTSLINLIPRFYDVREGAVKIDGIDVRTISLSDLRSQIGIVTQEPILFNDSVRNNISYGNPNATFEQVEQAAKAAYAYDFITGFPQGFDTDIGELGGRLSGGEKQRICIARAFLKNAPILILDEATAALDPEAETMVKKALENLVEGRTTFIVAHRLSTIAFADKILVLKGRRIVEEGTHDELMGRKKHYYRLVQTQLNK